MTTPAQYFHVLRRQKHHPKAKPLVLFTPKSLLRLPVSFSKLGELVSGSFQPLLDDAEVSDRRSIGRVILSSGKVFYDLHVAREQRRESATALVRLEQFYPFPAEGLREILGRYSSVREVVWAQEEPQNMGGWTFIERRLRPLLPANVPLRYAGRVASASPATGNVNVHKQELAELLDAAFG